MDPRHPEVAITRMDELMAQYKKALSEMRECKVSSRLGELEREGGLVVQELCLVAPRLHEAMIQVSRTRRSALAHGLVEEPVEKSLHRADIVIDIENPYGEIAVHDAKPEEYIKKPKKKAKKSK